MKSRINYGELGSLASQSIDDYLFQLIRQNAEKITGWYRALHLHRYLIELIRQPDSPQQNIGIFTVLYAALMKEGFLGIAPGRSTQLVQYIGRKWISYRPEGEWVHKNFLHRVRPVRLISEVFPQEMLDLLKDNPHNFQSYNLETENFFSKFDSAIHPDFIAITRSSLKMIIETEFRDSKEKIITAAKELSFYLETPTPTDEHFVVNLKLLPSPPRGENILEQKQDQFFEDVNLNEEGQMKIVFLPPEVKQEKAAQFDNQIEGADDVHQAIEVAQKESIKERVSQPIKMGEDDAQHNPFENEIEGEASRIIIEPSSLPSKLGMFNSKNKASEEIIGESSNERATPRKVTVGTPKMVLSE